MRKTVTVFGSSKPVEGDDEFNTAYNLGRLLAQKGFNVCTGGYQGIMKAVSKGAYENGAEAIGITVKGWGARPCEYLTCEIKCNDLKERLSKLVDTGDAYVILKGGTGTLLELALVWELLNKKIIKIKPVVTHSSMWKLIVETIDRQLMLEKSVTGLVKNLDTVEEIVEYISVRLQA